MGSKQCGKCGEDVHEAKAFCPGCGNAFVEEEERKTLSGFELSNDTVKLGDTLYNQLLSDMGLSISKSPNKPETTVEPIKSDAAAPSPVKALGAKPAYLKWLILGAVAALGLLFLLLLVLIVLFWLLPRMAI